MKITIEVNDIELFAKGFNNAIATFGDVVYAIDIGCEVPSRFKVLETIPRENLFARYNCLVDVYEQVEQIEKDLND